MQRLTSTAALTLAVLATAANAIAQGPFAEHVRSTEPLSAEAEQKTFRLPKGFEIQLVAAEPDIQKPLNMAFDRQGRLWVSDTREYPYPAPVGKPGRDTIKILEDTNGDGRADKFTTFADGLNIPIGILPYDDGAIAFSIPYIWRLSDTDGDGRCDRREKLYGPMGYDRDAHGLNNAFRRGFDGWIYACHGFNNNTTVKGTDGHTISMNSGNVYRFRADGSRIEQFTWGQVNPFGMAFDPLGNIFTADCHSKPIYQLLRGGYYPSFGKPHDGLGFVPSMMEHLHGSTAIAGVAFYTGSNFPKKYHGNLFTGNVMTCRVNRDSPVYHGSTIIAREEADFVATTDPWFRPVDIQVGPDGALYIADFYNRIIGHYEVPLDHPGRDRHRGRIWRVVYTGNDPKTEPSRRPGNLETASVAQLIVALDHDVLGYRLLATNELVDRAGEEVLDAVRTTFHQTKDGATRSHLLWVLDRLGKADTEVLAKAAGDSDRAPRIHAMKMLAEISDWQPEHRRLAVGGLSDTDAFVRRAAADALSQHPDTRHVRPLLDMLTTIPAEDNHLRHTARMALRNQLRDAKTLKRLADSQLSAADARAVAGVCPALESPESGLFLLTYVRRYDVTGRELSTYLRHAARYAPATEGNRLARFARRKLEGRLDEQRGLLTSIRTGYQQRGVAPSEAINDWARTLAGQLLDSVDADSALWSNRPIVGKLRTENPWGIQRRASADGDNGSRFVSSLPRGEQLTGILRSAPFEVPGKLRFYVAGHIGFPDRPAVAKNFVRLRDAESHQLLAEVKPPRNDTARKVEWDLSEHAGRQGYLEIVDGDDDAAYAWLAVGRFEPEVVPLPRMAPSLVAERQSAAAAIAGQFQLRQLVGRLKGILTSANVEISARQAVARALVTMDADSRIAALVPVIGDVWLSNKTRDEICSVIASRDDGDVLKVLAEAVRTSPRRIQEQLAQTLAGDKPGAETLLALVQDGHATGRLLLVPAVNQRLLAVGPKDVKQRIRALTTNLPSENEAVQRLIAERRTRFGHANASLDRGAAVYTKHCGICHQLDGQGPLIGPQLDGIGNRGLQRLIEDVLAPNRNVDVAFRSTTIVTTDGRALTGLFRRREGATLVFANSEGKEFSIAEDDIDEQSKSEISLMPDNVGQTLSENEFHDLTAFLLSKRNVPKETGK